MLTIFFCTFFCGSFLTTGFGTVSGFTSGFGCNTGFGFGFTTSCGFSFSIILKATDL